MKQGWLQRTMGWLDGLAPGRREELPDLLPDPGPRRFRLFAAGAAALVCLCYVLLTNRFWACNPDSAIYLRLGQNLKLGRGYVFNGIPNGKLPGGTAYFISLLLLVSNEFLWLNSWMAASVLAGLALWYVALREITGRWTALLTVVLAATLFWTQESAVRIGSEAPFFVFSTLSVILVLRLARGGNGRLRPLLLAAFCAAWAAVFWFRVLACFLAAPFVLTLLLAGRQARPLRQRIVDATIASATVLATVGVYLLWSRHVREIVLQMGYRPPAATGYRMVPSARLILSRIAEMPRWPTLVLWPPWAAAAQGLLPTALVALVDLSVTGVVLLGCWRAIRRGHVLAAVWPLYFIPFLVSGPHYLTTHGRYAIGVAPLVVLSFLYGLDAVGDFCGRRLHRALGRRTLLWVGIGAILLPNVALLGVNLWVQRRADYYAAYRAGAYARLMGIARWLDERGVDRIVADGVRGSLYHVFTWRDGLRVSVVMPPEAPSSGHATELLARVAAEEDIRYLMTFDELQPWPVWHLPAGLLGGHRPTGPYWQLWERPSDGGHPRPIPVEPVTGWPTDIPLDLRPQGPASAGE